MGFHVQSHGNYGNAIQLPKVYDDSLLNKLNNVFLETAKERIIRQTNNIMNGLIIAADTTGSMATPLTGAIASAYVWMLKMLAEEDLINCLCEVCGERLNKTGC